MHTEIENDVAALLSELSSVQDDLLVMLSDKRKLLAAADAAGLAAVAPREQELIERLTACHKRRALLLDQAKDNGLPGDSIRSLAAAMPASQRRELERRVDESRARARLLQHQSLTNWVLVQRALIHLSQLIEIIATGGRPRPTYDKGDRAHQGGALVDQAA